MQQFITLNKILTIAILAIVIKANAQTTYYIDATNGNDNNNGKSTITPWQTIDKINNKTFSPGDSILFKRGEIWIDEKLEISGLSGTKNNFITYGAYPNNSNPKPIITSIKKHNISWINKGNNIWKAKNPPTYHPQRLLINDSEFLRANKLSELDGINFFWLYNKEENGDLYIYSNDDPTLKKISYTTNSFPIIIEDANYINITDLDLQGGWTNIYLFENTSYINLIDLNIGKYAYGGVNINNENSNTPHNIIIRNCNFNAFFNFDYSMANIYNKAQERGTEDGIFFQAGEHCEIYNNNFKNWGHASINIDGNPMGDTKVKIAYISIHNNYLTSPDICYGGRLAIDDAHDCEIFNNNIVNTSVQSQINGYNNHFHHNIINGRLSTPFLNIIESGLDIDSYSNTNIQNNIYENNIIMNTDGAGIQISTSGDYNIQNIIIRNNILYNCGRKLNSISLKIQNNTTECKTSDNKFYNNLIFNKENYNTIDFRGSIINVNDFNNISETDGYIINNNISTNPLFIDEPNGNYHLQNTSHCINTGDFPLATKDYDGNTIPYANTLPDIGIYEHKYTNTIYNKKYVNNLAIYPNPTTKYIYFPEHYKDKSYKIFSLSGSIIESGTIQQKPIDLSKVKTGIYFIKIEDYLKPVKIIKQ